MTKATRRRPVPHGSRDTTPPSFLSLTAADALACDLMRELVPHVGQPDDVTAVLNNWLAQHGTNKTAQVCMRLVWSAFAEYMTALPISEAPPGALLVHEPEEPDHAS